MNERIAGREVRVPRSEEWGAASDVGYVIGGLRAEAVPGTLLVRLLGDLGVGEATARTTVARMVRRGQLAVERRGRTAVYRVRGTFADQLRRVGRRAPQAEWTGGFDAVVYDIPEDRRAQRDALIAAAVGAGWGSPRPGLLIGFGDSSGWVGAAPDDDALVESVRVTCDLATARRLAARAWPLAELADELAGYADEIEALGTAADDAPGAGVDRDAQALQLHHRATVLIARARIRVPDLPADLAPDGWPAARLTSAYGAVSARHRPAAQRHLDRAVAESSVADLIDPRPLGVAGSGG